MVSTAPIKPFQHAMQKHLLARLRNLLDCASQEEIYSSLRQFLAQSWLRNTRPTALPLLPFASVSHGQKTYTKDFRDLLSDVSFAQEGTPNALTPEIISLLNETSNDSRAKNLCSSLRKKNGKYLQKKVLCP